MIEQGASKSFVFISKPRKYGGRVKSILFSILKKRSDGSNKQAFFLHHTASNYMKNVEYIFIRPTTGYQNEDLNILKHMF